MPEVQKPGGFFTGWKGWVVFFLGIAVAVVIGGTGYLGSRNSDPEIIAADVSFLNFEDNDFGLGLYEQCITRNATYADGDWQWVFIDVPGEDGDSNVLRLQNLQALVRFTGGNAEGTQGLFSGANGTLARYNFRPEHACYAVCQAQLGKDCTFYTYDGINEDQCRFVKPGATLPPVVPVSWEEEPFNNIYNASCMFEVRESLLDVLNAEAPGITRPADIGTPSLLGAYIDSLRKSYLFFKAQWTGQLPAGYAADIPWRNAGFVDLDSSCKKDYLASFATGNHLVSTMAIAEQLGVLALGALWWDNAYAPTQVRGLATAELVRQGRFLTDAWDAEDKELLVGIGDGRTNGTLTTYQDFGDAQRAFAIGPAPDDDPFGPLTRVPATCTYATPETPSAEVAAHSAAALALGTMAVENMTADASNVEGWLEAAESMYAWSAELAPPGGARQSQLMTAARDVTDTRVPAGGGKPEFGVSEIYGIESAADVYAHQFWAACALYQATGKQSYWRDTMRLYTNWINKPNGGISRLFFPVPNFDNPAFYGVLCMAQSSPTATGIEGKSELDVSGLADDQRAALLLSQEPEPGTRLEVLAELWTQFVSKWIDVDTPITTTPAEKQAAGEPALRYAMIAEDEDPAEPANGMFRNSANAAWISAMFADLPGVTPVQSKLARCMALQTVNFLLGLNPAEISFQVGVGNAFPKSPFHKSAACPDKATREERFTPYFRRGTKNPENNHTQSFEIAIQCSAVTFLGNATEGPGGEIVDPVLPNQYTLTGALVDKYNPVGPEYYTDLRAIGEGLRKLPNDQAQVAIDANAGLVNAAAALAMLPQTFYDEGCPTIAQMQRDLRRDTARTDAEKDAAQEELEAGPPPPPSSPP